MTTPTGEGHGGRQTRPSLETSWADHFTQQCLLNTCYSPGIVPFTMGRERFKNIDVLPTPCSVEADGNGHNRLSQC